MKIDSANSPKARRFSAARLLLILLSACFLALWLASGVEYALSFRREKQVYPANGSHPLPSPSPAAENRLSVNTATMEELQQLPGIGPSYAAAIIQYRESIGGFSFPEELMDVPGIGQKRFDAIRHLITCAP